jgi:hypothetical protein
LKCQVALALERLQNFLENLSRDNAFTVFGFDGDGCACPARCGEVHHAGPHGKTKFLVRPAAGVLAPDLVRHFEKGLMVDGELHFVLSPRLLVQFFVRPASKLKIILASSGRCTRRQKLVQCSLE